MHNIGHMHINCGQTPYNDRETLSLNFSSNYSNTTQGSQTVPDPMISISWPTYDPSDFSASYNPLLPVGEIHTTFSSIRIGIYTTESKTVNANSNKEWNVTIPREYGEKVIPIFISEYRSGVALLFKLKQLDTSGLTGSVIFDAYNLTSSNIDNVRPVIYYLRIIHPIPIAFQSTFPTFVV